MLLWSKRWFEAAGLRRALRRHRQPVRAVARRRSGCKRANEARRWLAGDLNDDLPPHRGALARASRLELEFEKLYLKLFLPRARHGTRGASKRYAGLRPRRGAADDVEFIGMEVVRRDWTELAKQVQRELYQRLFTDQPVDDYLAEVVGRVRSGELDDELVYRKNLRKDAGEYTATTPPHVVAARKSTPAGGSIDPLRHHHGRRRAARQPAAPARSRALCAQADETGGGARAGNAGTRFRARHRR